MHPYCRLVTSLSRSLFGPVLLAFLGLTVLLLLLVSAAGITQAGPPPIDASVPYDQGQDSGTLTPPVPAAAAGTTTGTLRFAGDGQALGAAESRAVALGDLDAVVANGGTGGRDGGTLDLPGLAGRPLAQGPLRVSAVIKTSLTGPRGSHLVIRG